MADAPARPFGRNLADFLDGNGQLPPPEQKLREACARGQVCDLGATRPEAATPENAVRAGFVRFLALGGDALAPVHETGVGLFGGWIDGDLDLDFCTLPGPLALHRCRLATLTARETRLPQLSLSGSSVAAGIDADGLRASGSVFLNAGFRATGKVRLLGANIGGVLQCSGGRFDGKDGYALGCDGAIVTGDVFLDAGFRATGVVLLLGANIGGDLAFIAGQFDGQDGDALRCDSATISGNMFLNDGFNAIGMVSLASVKIGALIDEKSGWPQSGTLLLDGVQIGRFIGSAPTGGAARVDWLLRQLPDHLGTDFKPQPWEETIRVLREMGHDEDARVVAIAKQAQLRVAAGMDWRHQWRRPLSTQLADGTRARFSVLGWLLHGAWGRLAGYGYRPLKLVGWMLLVWAIGSGLFWCGMKAGYIAPTSAIVITNSRIDAACDAGPDAGARRWTLCTAMPVEYSTFQPTVYALDLLLPVISLQQDSEWSPVVGGGSGAWYWWGIGLRGVMWTIILFGWVASLMLIAILTNLVKKD